jgi:hypothetical protein
MIAGDVAPAFPIVEDAKLKFGSAANVAVGRVMKNIYDRYCEARSALAEAVHLTPIGWTLKRFNSATSNVLPVSSREEIAAKIGNERLDLQLIVAGFDSRGKGHIFSLDDYEDRGQPKRRDIPGYHAIGSGGDGAMYMMAYREVGPSMPLRLVLYYAIEGKYFGERAAGVGTRTDAYIMQYGKKVFRIKEKVLEDHLFKLCQKVDPRKLNESHLKTLNDLPGSSMREVPEIERIKQGEDWIIQEKSHKKGARTDRGESADPSDPTTF